MATAGIRKALRRDPTVGAIIMFLLGLVIMALGLIVNHQTHSDVSGLICAVGLLITVFGCIVAFVHRHS